MPRTLVAADEVGDLDGVGNEDRAVAVYAIVVSVVTAGALVSDGELVSTDAIGCGQGPQVVVYALGAIANCVNQIAAALAFGFIAVEVDVQRLIFADWHRVVQVDVVLLEVVVSIGCSQGTGEVIGEGVACTENVDVGQAFAAIAVFIRQTADAVTAHTGLFAQRGEATCAQFQAFDLFGGDQGTGSDFWNQTAVVSSENRAGNELLAVFQDGIGQAQFNGTAHFTLGFFRVAVTVVGEQAVTTAARATVQFDRTHCHGVQTETDSTLSEARLVGQQFAQAGVLAVAAGARRRVAGTVLIVTVHVLETSLGFQALIFKKAFGLVLRRRHCELRNTGRNSQCDHAPLHHAHRDLLLWFLEEYCRPTCFFFWAALSFCVGANLYHDDIIGDTCPSNLSASLRPCRQWLDPCRNGAVPTQSGFAT
ncbi:hypothetical protein BN844_2804 [Pseudomonas sp. SHC52]|nr:hypothetical protein BN844_2804 [Pseudomonas sp. SHC52]